MAPTTLVASRYNQVQVAIAMCKYDLMFCEDKPTEPTKVNGDRSAIEKWERCDMMVSMIVKQTT